MKYHFCDSVVTKHSLHYNKGIILHYPDGPSEITEPLEMESFLQLEQKRKTERMEEYDALLLLRRWRGPRENKV